MPSEKQASWIRAYLRERIETGEIDASQIDRLTVSEASGIISRNIQQGRPFFSHYVATRKGWSWVFIAQDKRRALEKLRFSDYWSTEDELAGGFLNKRLALEYVEGNGNLMVKYRNQRTEGAEQ